MITNLDIYIETGWITELDICPVCLPQKPRVCLVCGNLLIYISGQSLTGVCVVYFQVCAG